MEASGNNTSVSGNRSGKALPIQPIVTFPNTTISTIKDTSITTNVKIEEFIKDPGDWIYFPVIVGIIVFTLGAIGNGLTLGAYRRNKSLQTSFNVLIANLCCVELVFSCIIIPLQMPGYFLKGNPYPDAVCKIIGYSYYSSMAASLQNLVAIAVNRYIGIVETKKYRTWFTGKRLAICIVSIWFAPPIIYLPVVIGGGITFQQDSLRWYVTIVNIIFQAVGLLFLIVLYSLIMSTVKVVQKKLQRHTLNSSMRSKGGRKVPLTKKLSESGHRSGGGTSGDETLDDLRPSSMISGGFMFRPANQDLPNIHIMINGNVQNSADTNAVLSNSPSHCSSNPINNSPSKNNFSTVTEIGSQPEVPRKEKRQSLWKILFVRKQSKDRLAVPPLHNVAMLGSQDNVTSPSLERSQVVLKDNLYSFDDSSPVKLRRPSQAMLEMRRKKSLSAPSLPYPDSGSRKASVQPILKDIPSDKTIENENLNKSINNTNTEEKSKFVRGGTLHGSRYTRKPTSTLRSFERSHTVEDGHACTLKRLNDNKQNENFFGMDISNSKMFASSTPALNKDYSEYSDVPRSRMNTITRKIREQKSKRYGRSERRKKDKLMRKKHARERQLVNSSLVICIAFAVCILPTSLLYLIETLIDMTISPSISICISSIAWFHAVINPFIYGYMNQLYRKEFTKIGEEFKSIFSRNNDPMSSSKYKK